MPDSGLVPSSQHRGVLSGIHLDPILLLLLLMLVGAGLFVLYSGADSSAEVVRRQVVRLCVALTVMVAFAQLDPAVYRRWSPWVFAVGVAALSAVLIMGVGAKGAQRWLQLPGLPRFQPSELVKIAAPMMVSWFLASRVLPPSGKDTLIALAIIMLPPMLIVEQPDLGTALLVFAAGLFVLFLAGISWKLIGGFVSLVAMALPALWFFVMRDYQKQRVMTLLDPESDPLGAGWNIIQSKTAIGSGGLAGKGWLQGTQSHLDFLPESHTDFIVAVLAEEFGLIGVIALLTLYLLIIMRCLYIAANAQDTYSRLLAGSLTLTFFIYVFVNMGMVSGILPVVGVPLPMVSYGGTSIVTLMAGFGILMSIQTHRRMLGS
ncbi:rod shape-determining protein RodA [Marinobacteraceae bacterium S3BR75-40.1]